MTMLKSLMCAVLLLAGGSAWAAQVVGVVAHLSGPLLDRKADGSVKVLGLKSEVENGDTLVSEKNTYAQIRFVDNSEITLRPGTTFRIENFSYDAGKPDADSAAFNLVKGGLRSITGLLGKRNKEKFSLKTPTATIGIRGTTFIAQYVPPPNQMRVVDNVGSFDAMSTPGKTPQPVTEQGKVVIDRSPTGNGVIPAGSQGPAAGGLPAPVQGPGAGLAVAQNLNSNLPQMGKQPPAGGGLSSAQEQALLNTLSNQAQAAMQQALNQAGAPQAPSLPALAPGLHLQVTDGMIVVTNGGGAQNFAAGQFGFVPGVNQPPVIVPPNTGMQFVPPPSFNSGGSGPQASSGAGAPDKQAVDCIVR
jgi:hypothetical protein